MTERLTDTVVKNLPVPPSGSRITYDETVAGFGCRVTKAGARAFVLNYRTRGGRERRITIGSFPDWKTGAARAEASELKKRIDIGEDPLSAVEADRSAKTVADLCSRYIDEQLPKARPSTRREYRSLIDNEILPILKHVKVAEVTFSDIDGLHRKMSSRAPYRANRAVAVLRRMFNLAIKWQWRTDNPARGIEKNLEAKRQRYLSTDELARLTKALAAHTDQQAANIIRLLILTGARRGEVQAAQWDQFDLAAGTWTKPGSTTKQKTSHRVPLSAPARQLLAELRTGADAKLRSLDKKIAKARLTQAHQLEEMRHRTASFLFPVAAGDTGHRVEIKKSWAEVCISAEIVTIRTLKGKNGDDRIIAKPSARIHDLRHTYASLLASSGLSLPVIGALLGHTQAQTTQRYSHLLDDPLRAATERVGAIVQGGPSAKVVPFK